MSLRHIAAEVDLHMLETSQKAYSKIRAQGLRMPVSPEDDQPDMPRDITAVDTAALMVLWSKINAWSDFIEAQWALAKIDEEAAQAKVDLAEARATRDAAIAKTPVTVVKALVAENADVVAAKEEHMAAFAYRRAVEVLLKNLERDTNLVSRELTRRTSSESNNRRNRWQPE